MSRRISALLLLFFMTSALNADRITLDNGDTVKGHILSQTRDTITLRTPYGNLTWNKRKVRRIEYEGRKKDAPVANIYTSKYLVHRGRLLSQDMKTLTISTESGRTNTIAMPSIVRVDWLAKPILSFTTGRDMRWDSLWRSALWPGLGQFHHRRDTAGYLLAFGFGGLALTTLVSRLRYDDLLGDYRTLGYDDRDLRERTDRWRTAYNIGLISLLAVYLYNLTDSVLFAPREKTVTYRLAPPPTGSGPGITIMRSYRF